MFDRVLIANRGEIALRVQRTLSRLGIESVAIYSDADADAPHVRAAEMAVRIGPPAAAASYLHVERIVAAALSSGAQAIHPGYGFLSERPDFASACRQAGIAFVGPSPEAIALLGDKAAAKRAAAAAGLPVVPGLSPDDDGDGLADEQIVAWAQRQELPLLLKAAGGGGGRGMRVVRSLDSLPEALAAARREAASAFGDDRLIVERFVERARHIEIQVIADEHGGAIHLGERECSLQRRHQKVIEEAPSPVVGEQLRERMGAAAVQLALRCGYSNAGTVELIADRDDPSSFFFLEMNARLQVEHPVTEAVTGLDLVELQLMVASGEPLPLAQSDVRIAGHAVEARIYAEDPGHGFLPSTGRVVLYREPLGTLHGGEAGGGAGGRLGEISGAPSLRIDGGVQTGSEVSTHYDPMLAKAIAWAEDRAAALARLDRGLRELRLLGPTTNAPWLRALIARQEVRDGLLDTTLIERLGADVAPAGEAPDLSAALALVALAGLPSSDDPWDALDGWRLQGAGIARMRLQGPESSPEGELAEARPLRDGSWRVAATGADAGPLPAADAGRPAAIVRLERRPSGEELLRVEQRSGDEDGACEDGAPIGETRFVEVHRDGDAVWLVDGGIPARWAPARETSVHHTGSDSLQAPMPGVVLDVRTAAGEEVAEGDVLVVLESMKMELSVASPEDGVVGAVHVATGDRVAQGEVLLEMQA